MSGRGHPRPIAHHGRPEGNGMHVIGICGSPRRGGNSELLLDKALKGAASGGATTEKIAIAEIRMSPCIACGGCDTTGECVLEDGMRPLYDRIMRADAVIVSSPIHFGSVTAQLKALIDRFQCVWVTRHILKRAVRDGKAARGVFLCTAASDRQAFFDNARMVVKNFFAVLDIEYCGELFCTFLERKGEIASRSSALAEAYRIGKRIARIHAHPPDDGRGAAGGGVRVARKRKY